MVCLLTLGSSYTKPVKTGGGDTTVLSVVKFDPIVEFFELGKVVNMVGGRRTIPLEPDKLGGIKKGGYDQLVRILQYYLYKKCLKFKNVPIWSEGGVSIFQKCLKFKNVPKGGGGRGVNPNWDIVPNCLDFLF